MKVVHLWTGQRGWDGKGMKYQEEEEKKKKSKKEGEIVEGKGKS